MSKRKKNTPEKEAKRAAYLEQLADLDDQKWGRKPPTPALKDIPISMLTDWDDVRKVKSALNKLELGQFQDASMMVDAMGRDDRIAGVLNQRIKSLLGKPLEFEDGSKRAAKWTEDNWQDMIPDDAAAGLLKWGLLLGVGLGENVWEKGDDWTPKVKVWHPRYLKWRWDTRSYWVSTMDGEVEIVPGDARWILYTPYGYGRDGWMGALVRCLAIPFLLRQFTYRDWARYGEVHGLPMRAGIVPPQAKDELKRRFLQELANLSTESVIMLPKLASGEGFDVKLIEAQAGGWESFEHLIEKAEDSIAIAMLGQNLTTQVKTSGLGSGGGAQVHQDVRIDLMKADAKSLSYCIREQILEPACSFNFGDPEAAPTPCWEVEPPEDLDTKSKTLLQLGQAAAALKAAGVPVDVEELAEQYDVPMLSPEDAAAQQAEEAQKAVDQAGAMAEAMGKKDPKAGAPGGGSSAPPSSGGPPPARLSTKPAEIVAGQLYTDDVADEHKAAAESKIHPDLAALLTHVQVATDYEDLRTRIKIAYKHMRPDRLADILHKAIILAELNGRYTVLEGL